MGLAGVEPALGLRQSATPCFGGARRLLWPRGRDLNGRGFAR